MTALTIAARELRSLFLSPLAWVLLAVTLGILAFMFSSQVDFFLQIQSRLSGMPDAPGVTEVIVVPLFANAAFVLLLIIPLVTMRLVSDELRNGTLSLLFSAPVSMTQIVLGKYLGILAFIAILLLLITLMPLSLLMAGTLDIGIVLSGLLGLFLLVASFAAVGLFMSTLTSQPVIAAVGTFGILLLLWIIDWSSNVAGGGGSEVLAYLSILRHFEPLLRGAVSSTDVIYYLLVIATFLVLSIRRLDSFRLQH